MKKQQKTATDRLSRAMADLVLSHPFFATMALSMPTVLDDTLNPPTAATNGKEVRYHPDFVVSLTSEEVLFLVAHEVMHPVFEHIFRRDNRDPKLWNIAADVVVNQLLHEEKLGRMPQGAIFDPELFAQGNGVTERIYDLLVKRDEANGGSGSSGSSGSGGGHVPNQWDTCEDAPSDPDLAEEIIIRVAQARRVSEMAGKMSGNMSRFIDQILQAKVDWRDVLHRFMIRASNDVRSWSRPSRRFAAMGMYMPSISGDTMGDVVVAVDCSGSVDDKTLAQYAAELRIIQSGLRPTNVHVVYFDYKVCGYDVFSRDEDIVIKPHGGGGTRFSPIFEFLEAREIVPVACVVLTDLDCSDFGHAPDYPVLWVSTLKDKAPWGEVVMVKE